MPTVSYSRPGVLPNPNLMDLNEVSKTLNISHDEIIDRLRMGEFPFPRSIISAVWKRSEIEAMKNGQ